MQEIQEIDETLLRPVYDPATTRQSIMDRTKSAFETKFPLENDKVRIEVSNLQYPKKQKFGIHETKRALMEGRRLSIPLHGDVRLVNKQTGETLDERKKHLLANVPYMTDRGTFVNKGTEYVVVNQSRLRPGIYTRRKENGELEAHINVKAGTGAGMRMFMEPDTGVYRIKVGDSQIKLMPVLQRLGVTDEEMKSAWGPDIFEANKKAFDRHAFDKFYERMVGSRGEAFLRRMRENEEEGGEQKEAAVTEEEEKWFSALTDAIAKEAVADVAVEDTLRNGGWSADPATGHYSMIEKAARIFRYETEVKVAGIGGVELPKTPGPALKESYVTKIVAAPGIPQGPAKANPPPLFPGGKAPHAATQLQMPPTTPNQFRRPSVTPASVNDQLLQRVPGGADTFVAEQRKNFERDQGLNPEGGKALPSKDLIDFDKRDQPVSIEAEENSKGPHTYTSERRIFGLDPQEMAEHPQGTLGKVSNRPATGRREYSQYHGFPLPDGAKTDKVSGGGVADLGHELTHNYTGGKDRSDPSAGALPAAEGNSYITNRGDEYTQGAVAGLNAMRDITGEKLNDPQQVHQLFDEVQANPGILDSIDANHARIFRTYLNLKESNPEAAQQLRDSVARDSQYLVENEGADTGQKVAAVVVPARKDDFSVAVGLLEEARKSVHTNPSQKQKDNGNYRMGHVRWNGLDITIENPKGSFRRGVGPDGVEWKSRMKGGDYGYVKKTKAVDGDHLDVLVGPHLESEIVFVIDQLKQSTRKKAGLPLVGPPDPEDSRFNAIYDRLHKDREGGNKAITDSGGFTRGGIAETSGKSKEWIQNATDADIRNEWRQRWNGVRGVQNPGVQEVLFDMQANLGEPRANRFLQESVNSLLPDAKLKPDGQLGPNTLSALNQVPADTLGQSLMERFKGHHKKLVTNNPAKYSKYDKGWDARREKLWNSPLVSVLSPALPALPGKPAPSPQQPQLIKPKIAPPGAKPVPQLVKPKTVIPGAEPLKELASNNKIGGHDSGHEWWDECKCLVGFRNQAEAKAAYLSCYQDGWECGPITAMTVDEFKWWAYNGNMKQPCSEQATPKFAEDYSGWVGFDLDGTLAYSEDGNFSKDHVGEPIEDMLELAKGLVASGARVKIFTARASDRENIPAVEKWLTKHGLDGLEITNQKDPGMRTLFDDRVMRVAKNQGLQGKLSDEHMEYLTDTKKKGTFEGPVLQDLKQLKAFSDSRRYAEKNALARKLISAARDEYFIDSDDGRGIVGVTHRPSGFRFHMPVNQIDPEFRATAKTAEDKTAIVKNEGGKWVLYTADGSRVLGTHDSARKAYGQEYAIQKSQESRAADMLQKPKAKPVLSYGPTAGTAAGQRLTKLMAHLDGDKVGEVFIRQQGDMDNDRITNLFVSDKHRGQGIGRSLMERAIADYGKDRELRLRAKPGMSGNGAPEQDELIKFYEGLGFATFDADGNMKRPAPTTNLGEVSSKLGVGTPKAASLLSPPSTKKVASHEEFDISLLANSVARMLATGKTAAEINEDEPDAKIDDKLTDEDRNDLVRIQLERMELDPEISLRTLGQDFGNVGTPALLATSRKLLMINRGDGTPDDRDNKANQTYHSVDDFMEERILKDAGKVGRSLLGRAGYQGSLKYLKTGHFTPQLDGLIVSNSLSQAVPGINPVELMDIHEKITQIGEGGIPSMDSVPMDARNVHVSQLGLIDPIRTTESGAVGIDQRLGSYARKGPNNQMYFPLMDRRTGKRVWRTPSQIYGKTIMFPQRIKMGDGPLSGPGGL